MRKISGIVTRFDDNVIWIIILLAVFFAIIAPSVGIIKSIYLFVAFLFAGGVSLLVAAILSILFKWTSFREKKLSIIINTIVIISTSIPLYYGHDEWLITLSIWGISFSSVIYLLLFLLSVINKKD